MSRRRALLAIPASVFCADFPPALGASGATLPARMRRGFNLPDQAPLVSGRIPSTETLRALRKLGLTHVRLPVAAEYVLAPLSAPATISATMDDISRIVDLLLSLDYAITIDLHPGAELSAMLERSPESAQRALVGGWRQLAAHIADGRLI